MVMHVRHVRVHGNGIGVNNKMAYTLTISEAYRRASVIIDLLVEDKIRPSTASFRLEEVNLAAGTDIASDVETLMKMKIKHQSSSVFGQMQGSDDSDYDSSEEYEDSGN